MARAVLLSVVLALASVALPLLVTPHGPVPSDVSRRALASGIHASHAHSDRPTPARHHNDPEPHAPHCFFCLAVVGLAVEPSFGGSVALAAAGATGCVHSLVRAQALDFSRTARAPPASARNRLPAHA